MKTKAPSERLLARLPIYLTYIKSLPDSTVNISATKHLSQRRYAIAYYNVTEETAKYIASALQEMQ